MMAPMVSIRWGPAATRRASCWAARCGKSISPRATSRGMATNAATHEPDLDYDGGGTLVPSDPRLGPRHEEKPSNTRSPSQSSSQTRSIDSMTISESASQNAATCDAYTVCPKVWRPSPTPSHSILTNLIEGVPLSPPAHLLTTPEIVYLASLFVSQGVTKIRLTGGEPTVRRDIVPLMQSIGDLRPKGLRELALTTNGISLHRKLDSMVEAGLTGVNLSLDTLDPFQFQIMTRRKGFDAVMKCIDRILELKKLGANLKLKVNCVVMRGLNERDIIPFVELGREKDIEVRFIEYMPFGGNKWSQGKMISFQEMLDIIRAKYPSLRSVRGHKNDTSKTYEVPGFVGKVGFISSMTNDFCGTCNRLRITSDGNLKVCLHGNAEVSLRDLLRQDNAGQPINQEAFERIRQIELDRHHGRLNDNTILGWGQRERELLNVIGAAVKRKAEKHADMGDLENLTNRPMILIGG